jgi:hypothetical protein
LSVAILALNVNFGNADSQFSENSERVTIQAMHEQYSALSAEQKEAAIAFSQLLKSLSDENQKVAYDAFKILFEKMTPDQIAFFQVIAQGGAVSSYKGNNNGSVTVTSNLNTGTETTETYAKDTGTVTSTAASTSETTSIADTSSTN